MRHIVLKPSEVYSVNQRADWPSSYSSESIIHGALGDLSKNNDDIYFLKFSREMMVEIHTGFPVDLYKNIRRRSSTLRN
jgi:hypothetical protein